MTCLKKFIITGMTDLCQGGMGLSLEHKARVTPCKETLHDNKGVFKLALKELKKKKDKKNLRKIL